MTSRRIFSFFDNIFFCLLDIAREIDYNDCVFAKI